MSEPTMSDVEFELSVRRGTGPEGGRAEVRLRMPDRGADDVVVGDQEVLFDAAALREASDDEREYGRRLTRMVFASEPMRLAWARARTVADVRGPRRPKGGMPPLRVRLRLHPDFQGYRWETLRDPQDDARPPLYKDLSVAFSRFIESRDPRPAGLPELGEVRALIAAADPVNAADFRLDPVDAAGEAARIRSALGALPSTVLGRGTGGPPSTLNRIIGALRDGHDLLYLACHGTVVDGRSHLLLEDEDGRAAWVPGDELVERVRGLGRRPALAILASCRSALADPGTILRSVGVGLAGAGASAVIAMQGDVPMKTVERLMPRLFQELGRDGRVDRALSVAIGDLGEGDPWWMPVLFLRVRDGRLWTVPAPPEPPTPPEPPIVDLSATPPEPLPGTAFRVVPLASLAGAPAEVPPALTRAEALGALRTWVSGQDAYWPRALTAEVLEGGLRPLRILLYLFDIDAEADWSALVARREGGDRPCRECARSGLVGEADDGGASSSCGACAGSGSVRTETVTWEPREGTVTVRLRGRSLVNAHRGLPLEPQVPPDRPWEGAPPPPDGEGAGVILPGERKASAMRGRAEGRAAEALETAAKAAASKRGDVRDLAVAPARVTQFRGEPLLYPVFAGSFAFEGGDHLVYVDRVTGRVHVDVPASTIKAREAAAWRALFIGGIFFFLAAFLFVYILARAVPEEPMSMTPAAVEDAEGVGMTGLPLGGSPEADAPAEAAADARGPATARGERR